MTTHELHLSANQRWHERFALGLSNSDCVAILHRSKEAIRQGHPPDAVSLLCDEMTPITNVDELDNAVDVCLRRRATRDGRLLRVCGFEDLFHRLSTLHRFVEAQRHAAERRRNVREMAKTDEWYSLRNPTDRLFLRASQEYYGVTREMCAFVVSNCAVCTDTMNRKGRKRDPKKRTAEEAEMDAYRTVASGLGIPTSQCAKDFFTGKRTASVDAFARSFGGQDSTPALSIEPSLWSKIVPK